MVTDLCGRVIAAGWAMAVKGVDCVVGRGVSELALSGKCQPPINHAR